MSFDATILGQGVCQSERVELNIGIAMDHSFLDGSDAIASTERGGGSCQC